MAQALGAPGTYAYADVAELSLLTADTEHAERYMRDVLGPLAGPGPKAAEIRETLRRYLAHGRSRTTPSVSGWDGGGNGTREG